MKSLNLRTPKQKNILTKNINSSYKRHVELILIGCKIYLPAGCTSKTEHPIDISSTILREKETHRAGSLYWDSHFSLIFEITLA